MLVDDLLDAAGIRTGKLLIRKSVASVQEIVTRALETSQPNVDARRHHLDVSLPDQPLMLSGDAGRLAQVVLNLSNNAAKYTPDGGTITVLAEATDDAVSIRVKDTGIGIAPDIVPKVFEMFMQAPGVFTSRTRGLGIGLALVQQIVALHDGKVTAHSAGVGLGSEFAVWLPTLRSPHTGPVMFSESRRDEKKSEHFAEVLRAQHGLGRAADANG